MQIPGYTIERELGKGGMATVYLAIQESLGRPVALKVMHPNATQDETFTERFMQEGRTIASLNHPHIIGVYDVGKVDASHYLVMEVLAGGDLKKRVVKTGMPEDEALEILAQVVQALGVAHKKGFVHRDVKPENVLFRDEEGKQAVLTDFGIAKATQSDQSLTQAGLSIGTPHYMSPEQARGLPVDGRSDIYSLGIMFYEMLTGRLPYRSKDSFAVALMHVNDPPPKLPPELIKYQPLLEAMVAKKAEHRFANADELLKAINELKQTGSSARATRVLQAVPVEEDIPEKKGSGLTWAVVGLGVLLLGGGGGYWYMEQAKLAQQAQKAQEAKQAASRLAATQNAAQQSAVERAQEEGERLAQEREERVTQYVSQADAAMGEGNVSEAERLLETAESLSPGHEKVIASRQRLIQMRQELNAQRREEKLVNMIEQAKAAIDQGMTDEAERLIERAEAASPDSELVRDARQRLLNARKENLVKLRDAKVQRLVEQAETALQSELFEEAERVLEQAEVIDPDNRRIADTRGKLADARRQQVETRKAAEAARIATQVDTFLEQAQRAIDRGDFKRAAGHLDDAAALDPSSTKVQETRAALRKEEDKAFINPLSVDDEPVTPKRSSSAPKSKVSWTDQVTGMEFVSVSGGCYTMGSGKDDESPEHKVCVGGFHMSAFEVTIGQFKKFKPSHKGSGGGFMTKRDDNLPVTKVSWNQAKEFASWLSSQNGGKYTFRLPSEAEWEFACRSGGRDEVVAGGGSFDADFNAWFADNASFNLNAVGLKTPNGLGLFDMSGNVWEWVEDTYDQGAYSKHSGQNPVISSDGKSKVVRGGSWDSPMGDIRCKNRDKRKGADALRGVGFRLVRD